MQDSPHTVKPRNFTVRKIFDKKFLGSELNLNQIK